MKKTFLISGITSICLLALVYLTSFKSADASAVKTYIMVEIYEVPSYAGIYIHRGGGKTEIVPFKEFKPANHAENSEITLSTLNKLVAEGYEIEHTVAGLTEAGMITKVFLQKVQ
jgi:hypothetical protein